MEQPTVDIATLERALPTDGARRRSVGRPRWLLPTIALATLALITIVGPMVWNHGQYEHNPAARLQGPSLDHPAGTDAFGRDLLARLLLGARWTLAGAAAVSVAGNLIGLLVAGLATRHRLLDSATGRLIDALLAIPSLVVALALTSVLGPSFRNLLIALTIASWPWYARIYRGVLIREYASDYVEGATVAGASNASILVRHVLPNVLGPTIVLVTTNAGSAMLNLAALSFLGLGAQPPTPEWGTMISDARVYVQIRPWQVLAPGLCIMLTVSVINLAGDALRDAFDPRLRHR